MKDGMSSLNTPSKKHLNFSTLMPEGLNYDNQLYSHDFLLPNDGGYDLKFDNDLMQIESI